MADLIAGKEREKRGRGEKQTVKIIPFAHAADVPVDVRVVSRWWHLHRQVRKVRFSLQFSMAVLLAGRERERERERENRDSQ